MGRQEGKGAKLALQGTQNGKLSGLTWVGRLVLPGTGSTWPVVTVPFPSGEGAALETQKHLGGAIAVTTPGCNTKLFRHLVIRAGPGEAGSELGKFVGVASHQG